ncbi:T9SS type A sorting domain-containing protein [bacterium]|nr:T9SS type A sorting domain-containing protein [bacterium]
MRQLLVVVAIVILLPAAMFSELIEIPNDFPTIQEGIDASSSGDTILVLPGIYNEYLLIDQHAITLASMFILDPDTTWRDNTHLVGSPLSVQPLIEIQGPFEDSVRVTGLTIRDNHKTMNGPGAGIVGQELLFNFSYNRISANQCSSSAGGVLNNSSGTFYANIIEDNAVILYHGGFLFLGVGTVHFNRNLVLNNSASSQQAGISTGDIDTFYVVNNIFSNNTCPEVGGGLTTSASYLFLESNLFANNRCGMGSGLLVSESDSCMIINNTFRENQAVFFYNGLGFGSAIGLMSSVEYFHMDHNTFLENESDHSAALFMLADGIISNNVFERNTGYWSSVSHITGNSRNHADIYFQDNLFLANASSPEAALMHDGVILASDQCSVYVSENDFVLNWGIAGGRNRSYRGYFELDNNYWGHPSGPYHSNDNPGGLGDTVLSVEEYEPFSIEPFGNYGIRLNPWIVDWGEVATGDTTTASLWIRNSVDSTVVVEEVTIDSAAFTLLAEGPWTLLPGDSVEVAVQFHPIEAREHIATLTAAIDAPHTPPIRAMLQGTGVESAVEDSEDQPQCSGLDQELPDRFALGSPAPNPFNPSTELRVDLPRPASLTVVLYDITGREVRTFFRDQAFDAGRHRFTVDGTGLAAGIYFARVTVPGELDQTRKLVLVK